MTIEPASPEPAAIDAYIAALLARCNFAAPGTIAVCALSGGPDSAALVALAVAADLDVRTVHVDHGLRPSSADDASTAQGIADRFDVPFRCERVELADGANLESRARAARRAAVGVGALTGHTADDQAETLLLRLLRGAGGAGLAAMSPGPTKPILALRRAETHELCTLLDLTVADDPTNTDRRFRRNRMRHDVIPLLNDVADRDVTALLTRSSTLLREDEVLLDQLAAELDPTDARGLAAAPLPLARRSVRQWILSTTVNDDDPLNRHPPDAATVERVLAVARGDATGCDVAAGWRVERTQQRLRLFSPTPTSG
ncbi:tRNA lysidine(34) synthetase TilS [uncultured Ilumatobacter sp.]|uniref:tRNA lysidine(34) synthetase TilS n=1 Tax=uncultured Ilumatobacter sp. TaxID=879968 RepID=UPI00374F40A3